MFSINAFIFKEISESTHQENEKEFLRNLLLRFLDIEESTDGLFCINFSAFINSKIVYPPEEQQRFTEIVEQSLDNLSLTDLSMRLLRTVELLGARKSLSPIVDIPENWEYYEGGFRHKHNRDYTRDSLDSPIKTVTEIHHFPSSNYKYYQGYCKEETILNNAYLLDPYRKPWSYYHALPMKRELTLDENLVRPGMSIPERFTRESWLELRRQKFLEFEEKRLCQK